MKADAEQCTKGVSPASYHLHLFAVFQYLTKPAASSGRVFEPFPPWESWTLTAPSGKLLRAGGGRGRGKKVKLQLFQWTCPVL